MRQVMRRFAQWRMVRVPRPSGVLGVAPTELVWRAHIADYVRDGRKLNWLLLRYDHMNGRSLVLVENQWPGDPDDDESVAYSVEELPPLSDDRPATPLVAQPTLLVDGVPTFPHVHAGTTHRWGCALRSDDLTAIVSGYEVRPEALDLVTTRTIRELIRG